MVGINETNLKFWQDENLEYLRYRYPLNFDSIIVDIGAYRGEWSEKINGEFGCENILSFEPTDNITWVKHGRKINACAWIRDERVRTNGAFYYTSMIHDNEIGLFSYDAVDIVKHFPEKVDLLKINIEGAEYELIPHMMENGLIKRCRFIQIQFHETDRFDYKELYRILFKRMKETHEIMWNCPFVWESWELKKQL
jgi:hypothetical protein